MNACMCVCACVCVCDSERERVRERERKKTIWIHGGVGGRGGGAVHVVYRTLLELNMLVHHLAVQLCVHQTCSCIIKFKKKKKQLKKLY